MVIRLLLVFLGVFLGIGGLSAQSSQDFEPTDAHYLWPTNASHHLTSTFAETRTGHFHAALDIKTWGQRGYEIYATRDAVLYRMAIKATGYGKVLYLKHEDGSFSVYAHLMRFNDSLQQFADSIRFAEDHRPYFDRVVEDQQIQIEQGDVIAYSGASGIGPPHLHFELRTPEQHPFNPLLTNLTVEDNISPTIAGLSVEPLSPGTIIEDKQEIHTRRPYRRNGRYDFGTIEVSGPVGLGVNAYDQSNGVSNVYAAYQLSMSVDGQQVFHSRVDSFSYAQTNQIYIDRVYPLLRKYGKGYQRLFVADGNSLPFYRTANNKGRLNLRPGRHSVEITATDYFGNKSTATVELFVRQRTVPRYTKNPSRFSPRKIPKIDINNWNWHSNWVTIPEDSYAELITAIPNPERISEYNNNITIDLQRLDNLFMNIPGMGPSVFHRIPPQSKGFMQSISGQVRATFPKGAFYDTVSVTVTARQFSPDSIQVSLAPEAYPLDKEYTFRVERDSSLRDTSKLAFYKYNKRYDYWYLTDTHFTDNHIIAKSITLGTFITRRDTTPPVVDRPRLYQRTDGQWLIYIDAEDELSGINYDRSIISVNGLQGIAEYEPEDDRLVYYHPDFSPSPELNIELTVFDRMGNKTTKSFRIKK